MPRIPKPYVKGKHYCTSVGGVQHQKLCPVSEGISKAEKILARLVTAQEDSKKSPELLQATSTNWTVSSAVSSFLEMKTVENRKGTADWYADKLKALEERFGSRLLSSLTLQDGLLYKTWLSKEKEWFRGKVRRRGVGVSTVNAHFRAAKALFIWCSRPSRSFQTGLKANPWSEIKYGEEKGRERIMTDHEFSVLLDQCKTSGTVNGSYDLHDILVTLRYTTMRPGELRLLRWGFLSFATHRIEIPAEIVKTRKKRVVTMLDRVEGILMERKKRLMATGAPCSERDFVFAKPAVVNSKRTAGMGTEPISANSLSQKFRRLFLKCVSEGLIEKEKKGERIVCYSSRHARISALVLEGHPIPIIMADAGHTVFATTLRYVHLQANEVSDRLREADQNRISASEDQK